MTVTATPLARATTVWGNKRVRVHNLVFSSTYATGGETVTATALGLKVIDQVIPHGNLATSTDLATANPVGFRTAASGASVVVTQYEGSAAGTALSEKTNSEAYATGSNISVTVIGY